MIYFMCTTEFHFNRLLNPLCLKKGTDHILCSMLCWEIIEISWEIVYKTTSSSQHPISRWAECIGQSKCEFM